jgi:hypothetical protein
MGADEEMPGPCLLARRPDLYGGAPGIRTPDLRIMIPSHEHHAAAIGASGDHAFSESRGDSPSNAQLR